MTQNHFGNFSDPRSVTGKIAPLEDGSHLHTDGQSNADILNKSEVSTFPIVIIFFCGCVPEMFVTSYSVTYCINVPGRPGICFHYYCAVYDECKYSSTFWLADRTRLSVQYTISLPSLCKLIWRHWTYKMSVRYILSSVWVRLSILSPLSII